MKVTKADKAYEAYKVKRILWTLSAFCALSTSSAFCEFEFQMGVNPDGMPELKKSTGTVITIDPYAAALSKQMTLANSATDYWLRLGISSGNAPTELNHYIRRGYGRLELSTLIVISVEAGEKLSDLAKKRIEKKGKKLRQLAQEYKLDYGSVSKRARDLRDKSMAQMRAKMENQRDGSGK